MDQPVIASPSNPRARSWAALAKRKERDRTGTFLVEGHREVVRMASHVDVLETLWCEEYADAPAPPGATIVSAAVFDRLTRRQNPDGWAAIARTPDLSIDRFTPPTPHLVLVADAVEKPGNIGAILRSCDALGAAFLGSNLGTDLVNPNVIRSAQGSLFAVPTCSESTDTVVDWCQRNTRIVVTRPGDASTVWDADLTESVSIVIGSEDRGVSGAWHDVGIGASIPMSGTADSLNASVTAAIVLAEARRQRSA